MTVRFVDGQNAHRNPQKDAERVWFRIGMSPRLVSEGSAPEETARRQNRSQAEP